MSIAITALVGCLCLSIGILIGVIIGIRRTPKEDEKHRKKREFSKILAVWAISITTLAVIASYTLAALGLDPATEVTVAVIAACVAYLVAYAAKSLGEKASRNKHHLDEDGCPYDNASDEEEKEEEVEDD